MLTRRNAKEASRPTAGRRAPSNAAAARRARVERSRAAAAARAVDGEATEPTTEDTTDETAAPQGFAAVSSGEAPYGEGSHAALEDGSEPAGFPIKGNADSMLYHVPDSAFYDRTVAEVWFATEEDAEAAGFAKPPSQRDDAEEGES